MSLNTFPNTYINVQAEPVNLVPDPAIVPIHLPLFISFADKGPLNTPILGGANALTTRFGSSMLNERSSFFTHQSVFFKRALPFQQCYFVRVADPAATAASLALFVTATPGNITQYQRTSSGALILTNGQPTPQLQSDGITPVTQPGITLTYSVRELASTETISTLQTTTTTVTGGTATTYPLMAFTTDVGSYGNKTGFRLFYNTAYDASAVTNTASMLYSFQPVVLNSTTNIETPVYDIYNSQTQTFSFKPGAYDATTATYYPLTDVITNDFQNLPGLPYNFYVYGANVGTLGQSILAVSPELGAIDPYLIDIFTAVDANGNPYEHLVVDGTGATILNANVVNYLVGGNDGSQSNTMFESLVVNFTAGTANPAIADKFRYPLTHFYDSGFSLTNKEAIAAFYGLRDDIKITWSTQDVSLPANTAAQDQSTGSALRAMLLLTPESIDFGTQFCRADIYQQCGKLSDTQIWNNIVPATIDRMLKRCLYCGGDSVKGEPKGRPNSEVTIFNIDSLNWTAATDQQKQLSVNTGLNYIQYADTATLFYPDLYSVYPIDTSLLSSDTFVDYTTVYLKHIINTEWTNFAGRDDPPQTLYTAIQKAIDGRANYVFSNRIKTSTVVSQTAVDTALGYQTTVTTTVTGNMPNRVWQVVVPIQKATA